MFRRAATTLAKPLPHPTQSSTPKLSDAARHVVLPAGIVSTGYPAVRETCLRLKIVFDPWQEGAGTAILGKRADHLYAADAVVLSIPRQVGKTFLIGSIIFALCLNQPGLLVLWTAHRTPTANETFQSMKAMCLKPELAPHIESASAPGGNGVIKFRNGSRIMFGAREQGFGRGFTKVAIVVFDEAQILTQNAIDDMIPATNQAANPLILYIGTPPKPSDKGDVFANLRSEALKGESDDALYIEFSADEGADPGDREQWAKANPSFPKRTSARAMLRMKKNLGAESFLREALGIWDSLGATGVFAAGSWGRLVHLEPRDGPLGEPLAIAVAADLDQQFLSLGAVLGGDPRRHLGVVTRLPVERQAEFVAEAKRIQDTYDVAVGIDRKGPASFLIPALESAGVRLALLSLDDFVQSCSDLRQAVEEKTVTHGDYDELNAAVDAAGWRKIGDRRAFARKSGDISALEAVAIALWCDNTEPNYDVLQSFY